MSKVVYLYPYTVYEQFDDESGGNVVNIPRGQFANYNSALAEAIRICGNLDRCSVICEGDELVWSCYDDF